MTDKQQDDTIKGRIIGLLQRGYNRGQLINDFSFAERTVDSAIKDYREQGGSEADEPKRSEDLDSKALSLPAKLAIRQDIVIIQGLASAQAQITDTQLKLLREAKSDSEEVAHAAAEEAAWRVGQQVQEVARQTAKPERPNPMASMFSQTIQPYFSQALGQMFGMFGGFGAPGGMMAPPAVQPAPAPPPA